MSQNVEKARKEIEKIEAEEAKEREPKNTASGAATPPTNGDAATTTENGDNSEDKAVEEVTGDVKEVTLEDKKDEEVAAA